MVATLRAQRVSFAYGDVPVLSDVNLELAPGSSTAIMGASGSGKSTLLQVLAGMLVPSGGSVSLADEEFSGLSERRRNKIRLRQFGFVFQFGELLPELTLAENVELPLLFMGAPRSRSRVVAADMLASVGLSNEERRYVTQVSGGQQQRAAIARALAHRPSILLADEPTGSLDEVAADDVLGQLLGMGPAYGAAVVLVTHSPAVANRCARVFTLRHGTLQ